MLYDLEFDIHPNAILKRSGETYRHFIHRCNRSMAGLKADQRKLFGGGTVYRNPKNRGGVYIYAILKLANTREMD